MNKQLIALLVLWCTAAVCFASCSETQQPDYAQVVVLEGSPYERGLQHGRLLESRIRSLYATLLPNSLLPYLNRERVDVASVLVNYKDAEENPESHYALWVEECLAGCIERCSEKCSFSYMLMKESGESMWDLIPQDYRDEMQGIADGAGMPLEEILIMNTFVDTMLAFRSLTVFIKQLQAPYVTELELIGGLDSDGIDNNSDGTTDENDGLLKPWNPTPNAAFVEVPTSASLRIGLNDIKLGMGTDKGDEAGVDPCTIRIQYNEAVYEYDDTCEADQARAQCVDSNGKPCPVKDDMCDDCLRTELIENSTRMNVFFNPPGEMEKAALASFIIQAGDFNRIIDPPPLHARFMRDERLTISTAGYGEEAMNIDNRGFDDGRSQPPSISFAVRGSATPDGETLAAHHYALLDSNTTHKHMVLFVIKPDDGALPHVVLGYAGLVWGFSGMNSSGLVFSFNNSDSLDNPMSGHFEEDLINAMLLCDGLPIGIAGREILAGRENVTEAAEYLKNVKRSFGWNVQLTDADGGLMAVETDTNILEDEDGGLLAYSPPGDGDNSKDEYGRAWASIKNDDLRMASHFRMNLEDLNHTFLIFDAKPQRYWTSFYYRSVRAWSILGEEIKKRYGDIDVERAIEILRTPELVDKRDSMQAVIYRPEKLLLHYALGTVPATDGEFIEFDLGATLAEEAQQ